MNDIASTNKLWFIQMLRAVAALSVMFAHLVLQYWGNIEINELLYFKAHSPTEIPEWITYSHNMHIKPGIGGFGIAIFFLISGFVIPLALEKVSIKVFIIQRVFRIYPMVIFAIILAYSAYAIVGKIKGDPNPPDFYLALMNITLLSDFWTEKVILGVLWTLQVEIKFYLVIALLKAYKGSLKIRKNLIICALFILAAFAGPQQTYWIVYMFIGTTVFYYTKGLQKITAVYCYSAICLLIFFTNLQELLFGSITFFIGITLAVVVFLLCYLFQDKLRYSKIMNFFADISYPLYLVHTIMSYAIFFMLYGIVENIYIKITIAFCISVLVSYLTHKLIEVPTMRFGKKLSGKFA